MSMLALLAAFVLRGSLVSGGLTCGLPIKTRLLDLTTESNSKVSWQDWGLRSTEEISVVDMVS